MSSAATEPILAEVAVNKVVQPREVIIYSHSAIYYWWPVWAIGYLFALLTWLQGKPVHIGDVDVLVHPSKNLGVIYTFVFLLVILLTHISVRGIASMTVIVTLVAATLFLAYMDWWESVLHALGRLAIYMNLGFYLFFSSAALLVWCLAMFVADHLDYWVIHPGQMVHHSVFGGGEQSYDTRGMSVTKLRSDLFRHWVLGLGSGDLQIAATGARSGEFVIPNVLFVGTKLRQIQELVSLKPDEKEKTVVAVGQPE
jgi:hypothetical protein